MITSFSAPFDANGCRDQPWARSSCVRLATNGRPSTRPTRTAADRAWQKGMSEIDSAADVPFIARGMSGSFWLVGAGAGLVWRSHQSIPSGKSGRGGAGSIIRARFRRTAFAFEIAAGNFPAAAAFSR